MDSFIGSVFNDGKLVVIGWNGERQGGVKLYSCHCSECAKDPELHGSAIYKSLRSSLDNGQIPCGCSKRPRWTADQYRVLIKRKSNNKYTAIIPDNAKSTTKVQCTCAVDGCGYEWSQRINLLLNNGCGCQKCGGKAPITEVEAIKKVQAICSMKGWRLLGFKDGWQNVKSQLMIECSCGRSWDPTYNRVVHNNGGNGCSACGNGGGYDPEIRGWFYTHLWTHPNGHQFLKYGITNYPTKRIKQQSRNTEYKPKQLCSIPFDDGSIPLAIERAIDQYKKANNILNQVSREDFRDGYTETLPLARLDFVANLIQDETTIQISRV